jgi:hypothetical protein
MIALNNGVIWVEERVVRDLSNDTVYYTIAPYRNRQRLQSPHLSVLGQMLHLRDRCIIIP